MFNHINQLKGQLHLPENSGNIIRMVHGQFALVKKKMNNQQQQQQIQLNTANNVNNKEQQQQIHAQIHTQQ